MRIALACVAGLLCLGCESSEDYTRTPPAPPVEGSLKVSGSPEQMQLMYALAASMESARARCVAGDTMPALRAVDSLVSIVEQVLDTIPLNQSFSEFLTIFAADGYGSLQEWHTARGDTAALHTLTHRYQTLARDLQARRDSAQAAP